MANSPKEPHSTMSVQPSYSFFSQKSLSSTSITLNTDNQTMLHKKLRNMIDFAFNFQKFQQALSYVKNKVNDVKTSKKSLKTKTLKTISQINQKIEDKSLNFQQIKINECNNEKFCKKAVFCLEAENKNIEELKIQKK